MTGIFLRVLSVALLTAMSAVVHHLAQSLPVGQIMVWRSFVAALVIFTFACLRAPLAEMLPKSYIAHAIRGGLGAVSMMFSFVSLAYLPVAHAAALGYLAPVITLPLAAHSLGERISRAILLAAALGFGGVIVMLWSELTQSSVSSLAWVGIAAGLGFAFSMALVRVHIKKMTAQESTTSIAMSFALTSGVLGLCSLPFGWAALDGALVFWLCAAGVLGGVAHMVSVEAVRRSKVSTLAPFDYIGLVFALGIDVMVFQASPTGLAMIGMGLIVSAGLYVILQEQRARP